MSLWTANKVQEKVTWAGFTITNERLAAYLAVLLNEHAPAPSMPFAQDNIVVWKPGWPQ